MIYVPGGSEQYWQGFRSGIRGEPLGRPLDFHSEYERGWIAGYVEYCYTHPAPRPSPIGEVK